MMTREAVHYWASEDASNFPYALRIEGESHSLIYKEQVPIQFGNWLQNEHLIPDSGLILDLGSGQSTGDIFGPDRTSRSFAVDVSANLLGKNPIPDDHKIVANIGNDCLPARLHGVFSLATMLQCSRYLDIPEKKHAAIEIYDALKPGGVLVLADIPWSPFEKRIGQVGPFDVADEMRILNETGFQTITHRECDLKVHDYHYGGTDYVLLHVLIARKAETTRFPY